MLDLITLSLFDASQFFQWFVDNANYLFVFVFMLVESSFIPFPSEAHNVHPLTIRNYYISSPNNFQNPFFITVYLYILYSSLNSILSKDFTLLSSANSKTTAEKIFGPSAISKRTGLHVMNLSIALFTFIPRLEL